MKPSALPRMTHRHEGGLVVFMIGMTLNRWWRPDLWLPTFLSVKPMIDELNAERDKGMLGYRLLVGPGGPMILQYWESLDKLLAYATNPDASHRPRWAKFYRGRGFASKAVGIWHETYLIGKAESLYVGTPEMGLPRATTVVPVPKNSLRDRLGTPPSGEAPRAPEAHPQERTPEHQQTLSTDT
ncbi:DUF4188 domain-containing protein [Actinocrispum sp. NPDC049592]|uniref:DUF4188 domain-containing protein n=1 Tax=Actinocrispum sp. NPDC049592 TaxID=3154835 RepID=UPI00342D60B1